MWYNPIMKTLLSSPLHPFVSRSLMLVRYTGRKTGKAYVTPVNYFPAQDGRGEYLATTSVRERVWWRNLRGGALVTLRLRGEDLQAWAEVFENPDEVAQGITEFLQRTPTYARYFQVSLDEAGRPNRADILHSAQGKVLIKSRLR